jgi:hypothetical protein
MAIFEAAQEDRLRRDRERSERAQETVAAFDPAAPVVAWSEVAPPRRAHTGTVNTPARDETGPVSSAVIARAESTGAPSR